MIPPPSYQDGQDSIRAVPAALIDSRAIEHDVLLGLLWGSAYGRPRKVGG